MNVLSITVDDCVSYEHLPFPNPNHRDPFDRLIIVQAIKYGLIILGNDVAFDAYPITRRW